MSDRTMCAEPTKTRDQNQKHKTRSHMPTKTPKDVVLAASSYLAEILTSAQKISNVRVEAVKMITKDTREIWSVILSYDVLGDFAFEKTREFKQFLIEDDEHATVISMEGLPKG